MTLPPPDSLERLTHADLIGVVRDLIGEVTRMQAVTEKLGGALAKLRVEHQAVKDELARLKHLPPRPPIKPSGMDKSTQAKGPEASDEKGGRSSRRRGSQLDRLKIGAIIVVKADPPAGSRNKGFEDIVVQDLSLNPQVTRYRRERWETPDGKTIIAALDPGLVGGYGPHLHRLVLTLHFSGQVTCERITALLNGMGVVISKRQVVRLLTAKLETFRAEDEAVLKAGLCGAYVTVDDTGARHAGKNGYTTQIGSYNFTTFRTGPSKSRLAFLSRLCGGVSLYVINDAALAYMEERNLPQIVIGKFKEHKARIFSSAGDWERHLQVLGLSAMNVTPDPMLIASEGALWGAIHHQGLLPDTVIVSDDAGQFRVGAHALCWIHAERLVHKLVPANDKQRNAIEIAKRMIWWFYRALKDYKLAPCVKQAQLLRARFDRIFKRASTGYATLDRLLRRLFRNKDGLLRVLERPEIPINTNSSENDIRAFVTKRKISIAPGEKAASDIAASDIVETIPSALIILDRNLNITSANRAFYQTFRTSSSETEGCHIYELGNRQWDIPALRQLLEDVLSENKFFEDYPVEHEFLEIGHRKMLLNARQIEQGDHDRQGPLILLAIEDVTDRLGR